MKFRLLEYIRCPACRSTFHLLNPVVQRAEMRGPVQLTCCSGLCPFPEVAGQQRDCSACVGYEVAEATLHCRGCGASYPVEGGIPRLRVAPTGPDPTTVRTAASFGYVWGRAVVGTEGGHSRPHHFGKMEKALSLDPPRGLVLDAGCGDGIDLAGQARRPGVEVVGVELSDGGSRTSFRRSRLLPAAHVVQADLCRLPFDDHAFDLAYSYGVLHHLGAPEEGLQEIVRVVKPDRPVVAYLYEDFREREAIWRWLLKLANSFRWITTRMPHRLLYVTCRVASPFIYVLLTVPSRALCRVPLLAPVGATFPYRHGTGPFSLTGDLYDRLSAPVERRYTRAGALEFFRKAGLQSLQIARERGWVVTGVKLGSSEAVSQADGVEALQPAPLR